jgi:excinuclease UvrABC nuclease subunit
MPFNSSFTSAFSETGIATYAPRESGVYGIFNGTEWIYIGEAHDIEARLYDHLRGVSDQSARIMRRSPTHYVFERCSESVREAREQALIRELKPVCNL